MSTSDATSWTLQPAAPLAARPITRVTPLLARSFRWLSRPRRVLLLVAAIWVINVFDLSYTLLEALRGGFVEMNPVAAKILGISPEFLALYKIALVIFSSAILLIHRRHRVAELACWFLFAAYLYLGICWGLYYEDMLVTLTDPATNIPPSVGVCLP